jgi:hypothetical protein
MRILIILSLLASCATSTIVTKPTKPKHAPKGYVPVGVARYLNQGADSIIEKRREHAFKSMSDSCKGDYEILREGEKKGNSWVDNSAGYTAIKSKRYWYIEFKCK